MFAAGKNWADIEDDVPAPPKTQQRSTRWGDISEEDDGPAFRPGAKSTVIQSTTGEKGTRTEIEYTERGGKAVKIVSTYKQKVVTKKSNRWVDERKLWQPFGPCTDPDKLADYGGNKPIKAEEDIKIEMNKEKKMKEIGQDEKFWESSIQICDMMINDQKKKKYDANEMRKKREMEVTAAEDNKREGGIVATGGQHSSLAGKYVPPSFRGDTTGAQDDRNANTLRVMNLSEDTREGDMQNLFAKCGHVTRVFMPKHKEGDREGQHKGMAFVQFRDKKDADRGIVMLNGHGYDQLILNVSWAQPRAV